MLNSLSKQDEWAVMQSSDITQCILEAFVLLLQESVPACLQGVSFWCKQCLFHVVCTVQDIMHFISWHVLDRPPCNPEPPLCGGSHVFVWHTQEGAKGSKVKFGQRHWCGGTLVAVAAVQEFLCGWVHGLVYQWNSCHYTCWDYCKWLIQGGSNMTRTDFV